MGFNLDFRVTGIIHFDHPRPKKVLQDLKPLYLIKV